MGFFKIFCPIDFSDSTQKVLDLALKIVNPNTHILLYHAIPIVYAIDPQGIPLNIQVEQELEKSAQMEMTKYQAELTEKGYNVSSKIETSYDVSESILEAISNLGADLVVMGINGKSGLERMILGSTAESVIRACSVPILLAK